MFRIKKGIAVIVLITLMVSILPIVPGIVEAVSPIQVKINFANATLVNTTWDFPLTPDYLFDNGLVYGNRGNGYSYGWFTGVSSSYTKANGPDTSGGVSDERLTNWVQSGGKWKIQLQANRNYQVILGCARQGNVINYTYYWSVQGQNAVAPNPAAAVLLNYQTGQWGTTTLNTNYATGEAVVNSGDTGVLVFDGTGSNNIAFVEIKDTALVTPASGTSVKYEFGPASAPVDSGYTARIANSKIYIPEPGSAGWSNYGYYGYTRGINGTLATGYCVNAMGSDASNNPIYQIFTAYVGNGTYHVKATIGRPDGASSSRTCLDVSGNTDPSTSPKRTGTFTNLIYDASQNGRYSAETKPVGSGGCEDVTVTNGELSVRMYSLTTGSTRNTWYLDSIELTRVLPDAASISASLVPGSVIGSTKATVTGNTGSKLVANVTASSVAIPKVGDAVPSGTNITDNYATGTDITKGVSSGQWLQIYDVGSNGILGFYQKKLADGDINSYLSPIIKSLSVIDQNAKELELSLDSIAPLGSGYSYQIWSDEEYVDGGTYWRLVKGYGSSFSSQSGSSATLTWNSNGELDKTYKVYIRVKDSNGIIKDQFTKEFSTQDVGLLSINSITIDGKVPVSTIFRSAGQSINIAASVNAVTGNGAGSVRYSYYFDGNGIPDANSNPTDLNNVTYTIPADCQQGYHTIKVEVTQDNVANTDEMSQEIFVSNASVIIPEINGFNLTSTAKVNNLVSMSVTEPSNNGSGNAYRYQIGEPGRGYFASKSNQNSSYTFAYPGVYQVFGSIRGNGANSFSDGAIKYIRVTRADGTNLKLGTITMTNNGTAVTDFSSTINVTNGKSVVITAPADNNVQYSFWRLDARGYRLVKDWAGTDSAGYNSLTWTPAQSGNYSISVRVRDKNSNNTSASYEDAKSYNFDVSGYAQTFDIVTVLTTGGTAKRTPITITADCNASNKDNILYRFEINDSFMGTYTIQDYSTDTSATWIPRKEGTYKIIVRARDAASFGYYDTFTTQTIDIQ